MMTFLGITPPVTGTELMVKPLEKLMPTFDIAHLKPEGTSLPFQKKLCNLE